MITQHCYFYKDGRKYVKTYEKPQVEYTEKIDMAAEEGKILSNGKTMLPKVCCTLADASKWQEIDKPEETEEAEE